MGGSKSSSSSQSTSATTTTSASATGTVGQVLQGQDIVINQEFGDNVATAFEKLVNLTSKSVDLAAAVGQTAFDKITEGAQLAVDTAQQSAQPDVELVQGYQRQVLYGIVALAVVGGAYFVFKGAK